MKQVFHILLLLLHFGLSLSAQTEMLVQPTQSATPLGFNPAYPRFIFGDFFNLKIWDWSTASLRTYPSFGIQRLAISGDGRLVVVADLSGKEPISILDEQTLTRKTLAATGEVRDLMFSQSGQYLVSTSKDTFTALALSYTDKKHQLKIPRGVALQCLSGETLVLQLDQKLEYRRLPGMGVIKTVAFQDDFFGFSTDGQYYFCQKDDLVRMYHTATQRPAGQFHLKIPTYHETPMVSPDGKRVAIYYQKTQKFLVVYDVEKDKRVFTKDLTADATNNFVYLAQSPFCLDPAWRFFALANRWKGITLYSLQTGDEICQLYSNGTQDFIIKIPSGYYMATRRGAFEGVTFEKDGQPIDFEQVDIEYNRPDLVLKHVGLSSPLVVGLLEFAYQKRLHRLGLPATKSGATAPVSQIQFDDEPPLFTENATLKLSVSMESDQPLERFNILANGVPLLGSKGQRFKKSGQKKAQQQLEIALLPGDNHLVVEVYNQGQNRPTRTERTVRCEAPELQPDLYLVVIGVSNYADKSRNLRYADKDARSLATLFQSGKTPFGHVFIDTLLNENFTTQSLQRVKKGLLRSRPQDRVILFFAGHGIVTDTMGYFLGTHDVDFKHPEQKGLAFNTLEQMFDSIPARQRLLLLDACFSGEIDRENAELVRARNTVQGNVLFRNGTALVVNGNSEAEQAFNLMREWFVDLRAGNGATVLSSTTGVQQAAEGEQWGNGVFSWCLYHGLFDKTADLNKDGKIMLSELKDHLAQEVPKQTAKQQHPTFRVENLQNDWQIW